MKEEWKTLFQIFWTFFKISPVTFGGGFAMIPLIEKEVVDKRKWLKNEEVTDMFALSQAVPGAIAINSATFIGQRVYGIKGLIAAIIGVTLPTFIIALFLGILYIFIKDDPKIAAAFVGIRASVVALIVYAAIKIGKTAVIDKSTFGIFVLGVPVLFFIHPLFAIVIGAFVGIVVIFIKKRLGYEIKYTKKDTNEIDFFICSGI